MRSCNEQVSHYGLQGFSILIRKEQTPYMELFFICEKIILSLKPSNIKYNIYIHLMNSISVLVLV